MVLVSVFGSGCFQQHATGWMRLVSFGLSWVICGCLEVMLKCECCHLFSLQLPLSFVFAQEGITGLHVAFTLSIYSQMCPS